MEWKRLYFKADTYLKLVCAERVSASKQGRRKHLRRKKRSVRTYATLRCGRRDRRGGKQVGLLLYWKRRPDALFKIIIHFTVQLITLSCNVPGHLFLHSTYAGTNWSSSACQLMSQFSTVRTSPINNAHAKLELCYRPAINKYATCNANYVSVNLLPQQCDSNC